MRSLALVVIARDEAPRIQRLLDSVRPFVDHMLVLDTGSTDDTVALARAAGARVETSFTWCDDFAAARNHALDLASADWHLVLDADEWLEQGGETLAALRNITPDFVGTIELLDHFDGGVAHQTLSRLLPGSVRYAGRVHEQAQHALPLQRTALRVGHDGYSAERLAAKRGRNRPLLERMVAQGQGSDAYLLYQLGKDCAVYDEHEQAEEAFSKAVDAAAGTVQPSWWFDLVSRRLYALKRLGRHGEGVMFAEEQMAACAASPDFFFALGDLLLDFAAEAPDRAAALLPMAEAAWRQCLELGERTDQIGAVAGRGSKLAAHNLIILLTGTGRAAEASVIKDAYSL